jgi:molybdate transport system ATP-binding protein
VGASTVSLDVDIIVTRPGFALTVAVDVDEGETLAIVGPNGAGKSTLVDAIAGHAVIDRGHIRIDGLTVADHSTHLPAESRPLSLVRQDPFLFPHLSVVDNIEFGLRAHGIDRSTRRERALAALAAVDLSGFATARVDELSGGQAQRASLARAIVVDQPVLLLDEPLSRVDVANRRLIRSVLDGVSATQIIVTHGRDHARDCDRILAIEDGTVVALTTPDDLAADPPTPWLAELLG